MGLAQHHTPGTNLPRSAPHPLHPYAPLSRALLALIVCACTLPAKGAWTSAGGRFSADKAAESSSLSISPPAVPRQMTQSAYKTARIYVEHENRFKLPSSVLATTSFVVGKACVHGR